MDFYIISRGISRIEMTGYPRKRPSRCSLLREKADDDGESVISVLEISGLEKVDPDSAANPKIPANQVIEEISSFNLQVFIAKPDVFSRFQFAEFR